MSQDNGLTWSTWASDRTLLDPPCEGSTLRYNLSSPPRLVFLNPASTVSRDRMRVRVSYDDGKSWKVSREVDGGQGGYSSMTKTGDFHVAALYESGAVGDSHQDIRFTRFNLAWME